MSMKRCLYLARVWHTLKPYILGGAHYIRTPSGTCIQARTGHCKQKGHLAFITCADIYRDGAGGYLTWNVVSVQGAVFLDVLRGRVTNWSTGSTLQVPELTWCIPKELLFTKIHLPSSWVMSSCPFTWVMSSLPGISLPVCLSRWKNFINLLLCRVGVWMHWAQIQAGGAEVKQSGAGYLCHRINARFI